MKNVKRFFRHLKAEPLFAGSFESAKDVFNEFRKEFDKDIIICYANYCQEDYEGNAWVFYYRKLTRKYYEAYGNYCSYFGLEDQWDCDEEINMAEIQNRLANGHLDDGDIFKSAFDEFVKQQCS